MIIGLTGKKRSGKSTAASFLAAQLNGKRINFKDALVSEVRRNFPDLLDVIRTTMNQLDYNGWAWTIEKLIEEKPPLMRTLLQNYGTEVRRHDNPNYWVEQWKLAVSTEDVVITDDVRFINEADAVREEGGIIIKIIREGQDNVDTHQSEQEMDMIEPDHTICVQDGDIEQLKLELWKIIRDNASTPWTHSFNTTKSDSTSSSRIISY